MKVLGGDSPQDAPTIECFEFGWDSRVLFDRRPRNQRPSWMPLIFAPPAAVRSCTAASDTLALSRWAGGGVPVVPKGGSSARFGCSQRFGHQCTTLWQAPNTGT